MRLKLKKSTRVSIAFGLLIALAAVVMMSFGGQGQVLAWVNRNLLQYLGWTAILLPLLLVAMAFSMVNIPTPFRRPHVLVGLGLLVFCLSGLTRAGAVGRIIVENVSFWLTSLGAMLVLWMALGIALMVLFDLPIDQVWVWLTAVMAKARGGLEKLLPAKAGMPREIKIKGGSMGEDEEKDKEAIPEMPVEKELPLKPGGAPSGVAVASDKSSGELTNEVVGGGRWGAGKVWQPPPLTLLLDEVSGEANRGDVKSNAAAIERTLESFGINAKVVEVNLGPAVTQYALEVSLGTKLSKITGLSSDLALALAAPGGQIRIEAPIPGRSLVGIELPNRAPEFVTLKKMLESREMKKVKSKLAVPLGLDVSGKPVVGDLAKWPHVLIAGATGSGKSVFINSFIAATLFRASPDEVRLIMVDPKRVELTQYNGIPHLLAPVIVDPKKVLSALGWAAGEMERRYELFAQVGARNIEAYNELSGFQAIPYIVIVVDELADIMLFAPAEVEDAICRLAQMARATGIHLMISTQRPSVDVLTGLIKANIPARIAFAVSSMIDSRVIIDSPGAEKLLGRGDMLFIPPDQAKPTRIQGTLVSDGETKKLIEYLRQFGSEDEYAEEVVSQEVKLATRGKRGAAVPGTADEEQDELIPDAVRTIANHEKASASLLQRRLSIGYARAARILDQLQALGVVGPADGAKPREVFFEEAQRFLQGGSGESAS
jgi:S-DNA-T family DNA segregation ATPase FtsK/SpoIIIE